MDSKTKFSVKNMYKGIISLFNPVKHDVGKQEKCSSLEPQRDNFCKNQ